MKKRWKNVGNIVEKMMVKPVDYTRCTSFCRNRSRSLKPLYDNCFAWQWYLWFWNYCKDMLRKTIGDQVRRHHLLQIDSQQHQQQQKKIQVRNSLFCFQLKSRWWTLWMSICSARFGYHIFHCHPLPIVCKCVCKRMQDICVYIYVWIWY